MMKRSIYLKNLNEAYNNGKISAEAYDTGLMNAEIFSYDDGEEASYFYEEECKMTTAELNDYIEMLIGIIEAINNISWYNDHYEILGILDDIFTSTEKVNSFNAIISNIQHKEIITFNDELLRKARSILCELV